MEKTYKELYLSGEIELEAIDDFVHKWNNDPSIELPLGKYLGLNEEEEDAYVSISEDALFDLLEAQRK